MADVQNFCEFLETLAPPHLAEEWDNVGLLIGDRKSGVDHVMTCLTITPESCAEAVANDADLIVAHHPLPFHALKRITTDTVPGQLLLELIENQIAVFSPHTAFDSARRGINQSLAEALGLQNPLPLEPLEGDEGLGAGRFGALPSATTLADVVDRTKNFLQLEGLHVVGDLDQDVTRVAVACGSAGAFLPVAIRANCDCLLLGETNFHTCLEAKANHLGLILSGHYASERFAVEKLAEELQREFPHVGVWASQEESDPLAWR